MRKLSIDINTLPFSVENYSKSKGQCGGTDFFLPFESTHSPCHDLTCSPVLFTTAPALHRDYNQTDRKVTSIPKPSSLAAAFDINNESINNLLE